MFCSNCGNELVDGAAFCSACGAKVGDAPAAASSGVDVGQPAEKSSLQEFMEDLTTDQCTIEADNENSMYVVYWKDIVHSKDLTLEQFQFDSSALVEELDISATDMVVADLYNGLAEAIVNTPNFPGRMLLCDMEDYDAIVIYSEAKGDFPAYILFAKSYVAQNFSGAINNIYVQRLEGFKLGKKGMMSSLVGVAAGIAREKNETAASWGDALDAVKGFRRKEMRGGKYADWANAVKEVIHTALSADKFKTDVEHVADYLTGEVTLG